MADFNDSIRGGGTIYGDLVIDANLTVNGTTSMGSATFDSLIVDADGAKSFLVRADGDGGDEFFVDTTNNKVGVINTLEINNNGAGTAPTLSSNNSAQVLSLTGDLSFADNDGVLFGTGEDSSVIFDGTNTIFDYDVQGSGTAGLKIQENGTDVISLDTNVDIDPIGSGDFNVYRQSGNLAFLVDGPTGTVKAEFGITTSTGEKFAVGGGLNYWMEYDNTPTPNEFQIWAADGDGGGTDTKILYSKSGAADIYIPNGDLVIEDNNNIQAGTTNGMKIGTSTSQKIAFFNSTPVVQPSAYTPTNVTTDRAYDADSTSTAELADVLGTLIADLQSLGLIG